MEDGARERGRGQNLSPESEKNTVRRYRNPWIQVLAVISTKPPQPGLSLPIN